MSPKIKAEEARFSEEKERILLAKLKSQEAQWVEEADAMIEMKSDILKPKERQSSMLVNEMECRPQDQLRLVKISPTKEENDSKQSLLTEKELEQKNSGQVVDRGSKIDGGKEGNAD